MKKYDIAVIGGGPGGHAAAINAARLGAKTVLIEREQVGGVCLNWGCIPTKTLIATVTLYDHIKRADEFGLCASVKGILMSTIIARKDSIVEQLRQGAQLQLKRNDVDVLRGEARFEKPSLLTIQSAAETFNINASKVIIATGSSSRELPVLPFDGKTILDSKAILDLKELPKSLLIIGGGAIGCEFATIFNFLGVRVTLIEMQDRLLPLEDSELGKRLAIAFKKRGINCMTDDSVVSHTEKNGEMVIQTSKGCEIHCQKVLVAIGRSGCITDLGIDTLGIAVENDCITVNKNLETNVSGIYAIGDILSSPQLAHVATHEGMIAAHNAVKGNTQEVDYTVVPSCTYTVPEIAAVGLTNDNARVMGVDVGVSKFLYSALGKAYCNRAPEGFIKLIYEKKSRKILGGQIMGEAATEIIGEIALAVKGNMTVDMVASTIHAHPTLSELIQEAAVAAARVE